MPNQGSAPRDPGVEPRAKDVVRLNKVKYKVLSLNDGFVFYSFVDGRYRGRSARNISDWRQVMNNAEVIHASE